jgi:hypothetical protein
LLALDSVKTVQLAIHDSGYAQALRNELVRDGSHQVYLVEKPDLKRDGVVVVDEQTFDSLLIVPESLSDRMVVISRMGANHLAQIWQAGVRHVVFEKDSSKTAQMAVLAAELRLSLN